jgi:hypothetical protein
MTDPGTEYEVCRGCTMIAEAWQNSFLEFAEEKSRSVTKEDQEMLEGKWMEMAEAMLIRKRPAKVQKTMCLCEKAIAGHEVEGDKFCGGDEIVLEIRERKAQNEQRNNEQHLVAASAEPKY